MDSLKRRQKKDRDGMPEPGRDPLGIEAPKGDFSGHRDILTRSLARYIFAARYAHGRVLEIGSGRGYGQRALTNYSTYIGLDVALTFLQEGAGDATNSNFVQATAECLPFTSASFDSIIALEVIEHVEKDGQFLAELRRVGKSSAQVVISTPNRLVASGNAKKPLNKYHVREYALGEFDDLLADYFQSYSIFGQHEKTTGKNRIDSLIDRIPVRLKYLLPVPIQDRLSTALRPPLQLDQVTILPDKLENAHTYIAVCKA